jgi:hypothetical protein
MSCLKNVGDKRIQSILKIVVIHSSMQQSSQTTGNIENRKFFCTPNALNADQMNTTQTY